MPAPCPSPSEPISLTNPEFDSWRSKSIVRVSQGPFVAVDLAMTEAAREERLVGHLNERRCLPSELKERSPETNVLAVQKLRGVEFLKAKAIKV